jgi:hypothetical protein
MQLSMAFRSCCHCRSLYVSNDIKIANMDCLHLLDAMPDNHVTIFALAYIAMIPCANLIGFAGQELSRKLPHVWGVLIEITYIYPKPTSRIC